MINNNWQAGGAHRRRAEEEGRDQEGLRLSAGAGASLPADGRLGPQGEQGLGPAEEHRVHPVSRQPEEEAGDGSELSAQGGE